MPDANSLYKRVFSVDPSTFDLLALDVFRYQYKHNPLYAEFVNALNVQVDEVSDLSQIPFLPIEFFKSHRIKTGNWNVAQTFESSGTTGSIPSKHHVRELEVYLKNCLRGFESAYGSVKDYTILALLPSYLERGNSGLITMVEHLIKCSQSTQSGFYLDEFQQLHHQLTCLKAKGQSTILLGVTFALLDFSEGFSFDFPDLIIMETGGMKGRREEMIRTDIHSQLKLAFGVEVVHSEYGMTELFSQAYSKGEGVFRPMRTMKVMARDLNDPLHYPITGKVGGLNVIDLANIHSCAFIATQDMGVVYKNGDFEVMGRMDNSEIRGCNLMVF